MILLSNHNYLVKELQDTLQWADTEYFKSKYSTFYTTQKWLCNKCDELPLDGQAFLNIVRLNNKTPSVKYKVTFTRGAGDITVRKQR